MAAKKSATVQIHDARSSKKNPNAKYIVKSVGKNGEKLQDSEALNDYKAVKTHIAAMNSLWNCAPVGIPLIIDHTKEQKFFKQGYAGLGLK